MKKKKLKSKAKHHRRHRRPTALSRTKTALLTAEVALAHTKIGIETRDKQLVALAQRVEARTQEGVSLQETIAQLKGAIAVRDARIGEVVAERDRIMRLVDQFTSVQVTSHGTELRTAPTAPSSPAALRSGLKDVTVKSDVVVQVSAAEEKRREEVANAYRSSIRTGIVKHAPSPAPAPRPRVFGDNILGEMFRV